MLKQWAGEGVDLNDWNAATTATSLTIDDEDYDAVCYNLALRLAPEYGRPVDPFIGSFAQSLMEKARNRHFVVPNADLTQIPIPAARYSFTTLEDG